MGIKKERLELTNIGYDGLYELVDQNISDAIFRCTFDGKIIYANNAFLKIFGFSSRQEVLGLKPVPFYVDKRIMQLITTRLFSPKAKYVGEVEFSKKNGAKFYGLLSTNRHKNNHDEVYFDGIIRDVTIQREYSNALNQYANIQKKLLQISSQFINSDPLLADEAIVKALQVVGGLFGADRVQIHDYDFAENVCLHSYEWHKYGIPIGKNKVIDIESIRDMVDIHIDGKTLFVPDTSSLPNGMLREATLSQKIKSLLAVPMFLKNDCIGFVSLEYLKKKSPIHSENMLDTVGLFANMVANLSNRSRDQLRLQMLVEKTSIQNKRLTDFSFVISHHIRASIANLMSLTGILADDFPQNEYLEMISSMVDKLNKSVSNINQIIHIDQEYLLAKQEVNLAELIRSLLQALSQPIEDNQIKIVNAIKENLTIKGIKGHLDSIFYQILSNAIRYGTDAENKKILIESSMAPDHICISIRDFGMGVDMERYGKEIFKAGARFNSVKYDGMGMGLFITKLQVESLGGCISFSSSKGKGTTVNVTFPL